MLTLSYQLDDFSCAHRLVKGYQGKCAHLHGHTYRAQVWFEASSLNEVDMLVDFGTIKDTCNAWVNDTLDHGTLVSSEDPELLAFLQDNQQKHYVFADGANTTLERLSDELMRSLNAVIAHHPEFGNRVQLTKVTVWETDRASITQCA